jgi:hypothetical protein
LPRETMIFRRNIVKTGRAPISLAEIGYPAYPAI